LPPPALAGGDKVFRAALAGAALAGTPAALQKKPKGS